MDSQSLPLDIFEFENQCCIEMFSHYEGSAHDYVYMQCKYLEDCYYNSLFASQQLNKELIEHYSNRFIEQNKTPAFHVLADSENEEICKKHLMEEVISTVFMRCDLSSQDFDKQPCLDDSQISKGSFPLSSDFLQVFEEGFINNDGIGYHLSEDWLVAYRELNGHPTFKEITYTFYKEKKPISISSTTFDADNSKSFLFNVTTIPNFRRKKYSRTIVLKAMKDAQRQSIKEMYLSTQANSPLQAFYETLGFHSVGVTKIFEPSFK